MLLMYSSVPSLKWDAAVVILVLHGALHSTQTIPVKELCLASHYSLTAGEALAVP